MPSSRRDKRATRRSLATHCRERDWSKPRALYELQNGLRIRTIPEGHEHEINWRDPEVQRSLNVEAGEVTIVRGVFGGGGLGVDRVTLGIEVLPPEAEAPSPPSPAADAPAAAPAPRRPSDAAVEQCLRTIIEEYPDGPTREMRSARNARDSEEWLLAEMKERLKASPRRDRVRSLRLKIAPDWPRPRGRPRNKKSAKKSAV